MSRQHCCHGSMQGKGHSRFRFRLEDLKVTMVYSYGHLAVQPVPIYSERIAQIIIDATAIETNNRCKLSIMNPSDLTASSN